MLLETRNLGKSFGGLLALDELQLRVPEGALYGLIGPNGAGKTTVFNLLSGFITPTTGDIFFNGVRITGLPPEGITRLGIARTFQNIRLFEDLSVLDNVLVGFHCRRRAAWWQAALRFPGYLREERAYLARGRALLEEVGLIEAAEEKAGQLPYGHQRRLEITRALATEPKLLLLDEPAAGLNPQETRELMDFLRSVHQKHGLAILVIEHNLRLVMGLCEQITVLDHGLTLAAGPPQDVRRNPAVIKAYLGQELAR
jgi:branched-chain amino acid transport system ATP-binding protein